MNTEPDLTIQTPGANGASSAIDALGEELRRWQQRFETQPPLIQRFFEGQAGAVADAYVQNAGAIAFSLPTSVLAEPGGRPQIVPPNYQKNSSSGFLNTIMRSDARTNFRSRLDEIEGSGDPPASLAAGLLRYATSAYMVYTMLPGGRSVLYQAVEGEEIPSVPVAPLDEAGSAITASSDAIVEEATADDERGELLVPYVPAARRFYLPQWVAFDDAGRLLVSSIEQAEAYVASMKRFVGVLHGAVAIAPYIVADEEYQRKRYGILGQLVNQGRALARHQTLDIIKTIQTRAAGGELNRGLSLSLPYFDDQALEMRLHDFQVTPQGRIMYNPGFVVRAASLELAKVAQDTRLSASTRKYLLNELQMLVEAFLPPAS